MDNTYLNQMTTVLDRYTAENTDGSLPRSPPPTRITPMFPTVTLKTDHTSASRT
jgi:hypothetical protein